MSLEELKKNCEGCQKCALHETRTNCVFGVGNPNASLMFVGEAPGEQEDLSGTPFGHIEIECCAFYGGQLLINTQSPKGEPGRIYALDPAQLAE